MNSIIHDVGLGAGFMAAGLSCVSLCRYVKFRNKVIDSKVRGEALGLIQKMGIAKKIKYLSTGEENENSTFNIFGRPVVVLNTSSKFIIAHELAHIKSNHSRKKFLAANAVLVSSIAISHIGSSFIVSSFVANFLHLGFLGGCLFGIQRMRIRHERQADLIASQYVNGNDIARSIREFNHIHHLYQIENDLSRSAPIHFRWILKLQKSLDCHPSIVERIEFLRGEFYKREIDSSVSIVANDVNFEMSQEESNEIRALIDTSFRRDVLFNFSLIQLRKGVQKDNVSFIFEDDMNRVSYSINSYLVDRYLETGELSQLRKIITELVNSPEYLKFQLNPGQTEHQLKVLCKRFPDYDWENARMDQKPEGVEVVVFKKS